MKTLLPIICILLAAGCGSNEWKQAYDAQQGAVDSQQHLVESQQKALDAFRERIESAERLRNDEPPVITREQLAGIYRRLVELEKRAGIRDAEGNKISPSEVRDE